MKLENSESRLLVGEIPAGSVMSKLETAVLNELSRLKPETSACPGAVAKKLGTTLRELRPTLEKMAADETIMVTQKGIPVNLAHSRGPVRIRPARD